MELLEQIPRTMFLEADRAQQTRLLDHIRAKPGESICIAEYAFTLKNFSDVLVERKLAGVKVYVLVDLTWSKSCQNALKVIGDLQAAGVDVKHLGSQRMHFKLIIVGITYAAGIVPISPLLLSPRTRTTSRRWRDVAKVLQTARELFYEQYNSENARLAQESEFAAALAHLAATKANAALVAKKAGSK